LSAESERQVGRSRKLICLDADQPDHHPRSDAPPEPSYRLHRNVLYRVVKKLDLPLKACAQCPLSANLIRQGGQAAKRVTGQEPFPIADDVSKIVVL
jgi:hypothetical protein